MSMSRCTNFTLANGIDSISIRWDLLNGEFELKRSRLPGSDEKEQSKTQSILIRTTDLNPQDWIELSNTFLESFGKLFCTYKNVPDMIAEIAEEEFGCQLQELLSFDDDDDEDDDDDDDDD